MKKIKNKKRSIFFKILFFRNSVLAIFLSTLCLSCFAKDKNNEDYKLPTINEDSEHNLDSLKSSASEEQKVLQTLSRVVSEITEKSRKAVVFVSTSQTLQNNNSQLHQYEELFEFFFGVPPNKGPQPQEKRMGAGSGFFIDKEKKLILTNAHVIRSADEITIKPATINKTYKA